LSKGGAEVALITDRHYELDGLPHAFRLEKVLRLWDPKPEAESPSRPAGAFRKLRRLWRACLYYREWVRLILHLRRAKPDLVQFGDVRFPTDLAGLAFLRLLGLRLTDICHNVYPFAAGGGRPRSSRLLRFLFGRVYRQFETVFVHYETNRREFLSAFGLDPGRVACLPHGNQALFEELRDPARDPQALARELRLPPEARVVLSFGTMSRYKGADVLLHAFARVRRGEARARLVLAGFPAPDFDLAAHEALARRLGLGEDVRFVPRYVESAAVVTWMALAAVAVFPYKAVFQSGALHVAQTFGVPIVATRVGAMAEVIADGQTGLLVPAEDPEALADAVLRVLGDPDLARGLGRKARADALSRFAWEKVAGLVLDRYRALLAGGTQ
jgi:glycosyltransferase involved in cell wall biosynthesis